MIDAPAPSPLQPLPPQPSGVPFPGAEWPTGDPAGVDLDRLNAELDRAFPVDRTTSDPDGAPDGDLDGLGRSLSLVIIQGGRLVAERYGPTSGPDEAFISWSMAKSVTQALVGICVRDGLVDLGPTGLETWVADDPRAAITLDHLLLMRSGLAWNEDYVDDRVSDVIDMLFGAGADDMAGYAAAKPPTAEPGVEYYYSSGTSNIVARLIGRAVTAAGYGEGEAGMRAFMAAELFGPLGMASADPRFDTAGTFIGSSYLYATARDFARFGLLYLRDGVWDGRRILPEGWVERVRRPQGHEPETMTSHSHHWWVYDDCPHGSFQASGYEGQAIVVVPGLDLIVVRLGKTPEANGPEPTFLHLAEIIAAFAEAKAA